MANTHTIKINVVYSFFLSIVFLKFVLQNSKRGNDLKGRNDGNVIVIFPNEEIPVSHSSVEKSTVKPGDYVVVEVRFIL